MSHARFSALILAGALLAGCDSSPIQPTQRSLAPRASYDVSKSTSFSESFDSGVLSPSGKLEAVGTGFSFSNGSVVFGDYVRSYLRTTGANYHKTNFTAEITVTVPSGGPDGIAFVGLGAGDTGDCWFFCEPAAWPSIYARLLPDGFNPGTQVTTVSGEYAIDEGARTYNTTSGTHRVRLTWNATAGTLFVAIDNDYVDGADFVADATVGPVSVPAGMFADGTGRIFFGGAAGVTFNDLKIVATPAK